MSKSALSIMLAVAIIVIVVIAIAAGAYYYTTTLTPSTTPSPSASSTPSASSSPSASSTPSGTTTASSSASPTAATSATPAPSTQPIANFHAGVYANYTITTYDNVTGALKLSLPYYWVVSDGTVNGTSVWVVTMSTTVTSGNATVQSLLIWNIDKTTYKPISGRLQAISGGVITVDQSIDLTSPQYNSSASVIAPSTIVGQESVTVTAGTFNCEKATHPDAPTGGIANIWINSAVPMWGIVKTTTTVGTVVVDKTELIAYG